MGGFGRVGVRVGVRAVGVSAAGARVVGERAAGGRAGERVAVATGCA